MAQSRDGMTLNFGLMTVNATLRATENYVNILSGKSVPRNKEVIQADSNLVDFRF